MTNTRDNSDVIKLHDSIIQRFGGMAGVRDESLLAAALERPFIGLSDGTELFQTIDAKAAALLHALIQYHPFVDGNKRTGVAVTQIYLLEHNYHWEFDQDEIVDFVIKIADAKLTLEDIAQWIGRRLKPRTPPCPMTTS